MLISPHLSDGAAAIHAWLPVVAAARPAEGIAGEAPFLLGFARGNPPT